MPPLSASTLKDSIALTCTEPLLRVIIAPGLALIKTTSVAIGSRPPSQFAGSLQSPPSGLVHRIVATSASNIWRAVPGASPNCRVSERGTLSALALLVSSCSATVLSGSTTASNEYFPGGSAFGKVTVVTDVAASEGAKAVFSSELPTLRSCAPVAPSSRAYRSTLMGCSTATSPTLRRIAVTSKLAPGMRGSNAPIRGASTMRSALNNTRCSSGSSACHRDGLAVDTVRCAPRGDAERFNRPRTACTNGCTTNGAARRCIGVPLPAHPRRFGQVLLIHRTCCRRVLQ